MQLAPQSAIRGLRDYPLPFSPSAKLTQIKEAGSKPVRAPLSGFIGVAGQVISVSFAKGSRFDDLDADRGSETAWRKSAESAGTLSDRRASIPSEILHLPQALSDGKLPRDSLQVEYDRVL